MKPARLFIAAMLVLGMLTRTAAALVRDGDVLTISGDIDRARARAGYVFFDDGPAQYVYAGPIVVTLLDRSRDGIKMDLATFCTDVGIAWSCGSHEYVAVPYTDHAGIAPTWVDNPHGMENAVWIFNHLFIPHAASLSSEQGAALQLAIWKVLYDTGADGTVSSGFDAGRLRASGFGALEDADGYVAQVNLARAAAFSIDSALWLKPLHNDSQGLIFSANAVVPETGTLIAGAILLLPFAASTVGALLARRLRTGLGPSH
jgi:hypothetical protein